MHYYRTLLQPLEEHGWVVADGLIPSALVKRLYQSAQVAWNQGLFHDAHVGTQHSALHDPTIRGDKIFWLDDTTPLDSCQEFFIWAADMQQRLNDHFRLNLKRAEWHFARYDTGSGYRTHIDQHQGQPYREITLILYLNSQWDELDGGELCLYCFTDHSHETQRILPRHSRLVMFRSGLIPHAVLPCARPRWSLSGWFRTDDDNVIQPRRH